MNDVIFGSIPKQVMKLIYSILILSVLTACALHNKTNNDQGQTNTTLQIKAEIGETSIPSEPFTISTVKIQGNKMFIDISFSGGCTAHEFKMVGSRSIAKSLPPIRQIQLIHLPHLDKCERLTKQTLEIDIKELAYQQESGSKIILTLEGWKEPIEYEYQ
jgi:hypothetical protein